MYRLCVARYGGMYKVGWCLAIYSMYSCSCGIYRDYRALLAVDDIKRQEVLVPSKETLLLPDYEPSQRQYMLQCEKHKEWKIEEQEEITSIKDNEVWEKVTMPYGTNPLPLK